MKKIGLISLCFCLILFCLIGCKNENPLQDTPQPSDNFVTNKENNNNQKKNQVADENKKEAEEAAKEAEEAKKAAEEAERKAKEEAEKKAAEEAAKKAEEERLRAEAERKAAEEAARKAEEERKAAEEADKQAAEAEKKAQESAAEKTSENVTPELKEKLEALKTCRHCGHANDGTHHRFICDTECPDCGVFVKALTCHTCWE